MRTLLMTIKKCRFKYIRTYLLYKLRLVDKQVVIEENQKYIQSLSEKESILELTRWFELLSGEKLIIEKPETFNQKIQWLKIYDSTELKSQLADKYKVRKWIAGMIGEEYLVPLLGSWDTSAEVSFDSLPEQFVLKANHGSGMNVVVRDKSSIDIKNIRRLFDHWMSLNFGYTESMELHYRTIKPVIIAEQYIENTDNELYDYKVYCFNGKPTYIQFIRDRHGEGEEAFFDTNWQVTDIINRHFRKIQDASLPPKPDQLDKLINLAGILSAPFAFVRVDFYLLGNDKIFFGEMTFTPASGISEWVTPEINRMLGELLVLPEKTKYSFQ